MGAATQARPGSARALRWKWSVMGVTVAFFIGMTQLFHITDPLRGSGATAAAQTPVPGTRSGDCVYQADTWICYAQPYPAGYGRSDSGGAFGTSGGSYGGTSGAGAFAAVPHTRSGGS